MANATILPWDDRRSRESILQTALGLNIALLGQGTIYEVTLGLQLGVLLAALVGVGIARYYVLVTWATVVALVNYARRGVPTTWEPAEGTR